MNLNKLHFTVQLAKVESLDMDLLCFINKLKWGTMQDRSLLCCCRSWSWCRSQLWCCCGFFTTVTHQCVCVVLTKSSPMSLTKYEVRDFRTRERVCKEPHSPLNTSDKLKSLNSIPRKLFYCWYCVSGDVAKCSDLFPSVIMCSICFLDNIFFGDQRHTNCEVLILVTKFFVGRAMFQMTSWLKW